MSKVLAVVALALLLQACVKEPVSSSTTNNQDVTVGMLFEHEGCKVYRFMDAGERIYYVVCARHGQAELTYEQTRTRNCGKNCTTHYTKMKRVQTLEIGV